MTEEKLSDFISITFHDPLREAESPFAHAWAELPLADRRVTEMRVAEMIYLLGRRDERIELTAIHNEDLKEIARAARERVVR